MWHINISDYLCISFGYGSGGLCPSWCIECGIASVHVGPVVVEFVYD